METVQAICQEMENVLSLWKKKELQPTSSSFTVLYKVLDTLNALIEGAVHAPSSIAQLVDELKAVQENKEPIVPPQPVLKPQAPLEITPKEPVKEAENKIEAPSESAMSEPPLEQPSPPKLEPLQEESNTIRVSTQKLDLLFHRIEELLTLKIHAQQRNSELELVQEMILAAQKGRLTEVQADLFKSINEKMSTLVRKSSQEGYFISGLVGTLLDATKNARMQPFSTMLEAFPRMVRDLAHSLNKEVKIEFVNCDIEIDRRILEELKDPFIHLVRNSVDHGIEPREERIKKGKPLAGLIKITLSKVGGSVVEILFSDDGRGINIDKLRQVAEKQGFYSHKEIAAMKDSEVVHLIFRSGISTSPIITDLSGRGLGVGIVQEKVEKIGGMLTIETVKDVGTTFKIVLPLTLVTFRGIFITVGGQDFILPINNIIKVQRIGRQQIKVIEGRFSILWNDKYIPFAYLSDILQLPKNNKDSAWIPILVLKAGDAIAAVGADFVLSEIEVFAKNLGSHLKRVRYIAAATVLEEGKVIPILDVYDIVKTTLYTTESNMISKKEEQVQKKRTLLVVEDSMTTRVLIKNILESKGYNVKVAIDGQEGFEHLQKDADIDLVVSDVEMPRMNGFELLEKVRSTESLKKLPFILCTTRGSPEDLKHGIDLGANAYIDKSKFTQGSLLDIIEKII